MYKIIYNHLQLFIINYNNLQDNLQSFTRRFTTIHNYIKDDLQPFMGVLIGQNYWVLFSYSATSFSQHVTMFTMI